MKWSKEENRMLSVMELPYIKKKKGLSIICGDYASFLRVKLFMFEYELTDEVLLFQII